MTETFVPKHPTVSADQRTARDYSSLPDPEAMALRMQDVLGVHGAPKLVDVRAGGTWPKFAVPLLGDFGKKNSVADPWGQGFRKICDLTLEALRQQFGCRVNVDAYRDASNNGAIQVEPGSASAWKAFEGTYRREKGDMRYALLPTALGATFMHGGERRVYAPEDSLGAVLLAGGLPLTFPHVAWILAAYPELLSRREHPRIDVIGTVVNPYGKAASRRFLTVGFGAALCSLVWEEENGVEPRSDHLVFGLSHAGLATPGYGCAAAFPEIIPPAFIPG